MEKSGVLALVASAALVVVGLPGSTASAHTGKPNLAAAAGWWVPDSNRIFPASASYPDSDGVVTVIHVGGPVNTRGNPFFTALGSNGRACVSCHQPTDGMSVSVQAIQARWVETHGRDPIFAAIDGSNCPSLPQNRASSHSLLLTRGLFRVARPWPPRAPNGRVIKPQFSIQVIHDPTGCNLSPIYGLYSAHPMISVYRRPRPAANLKYATAYGFVFDPKTGLPLPIDPRTGLRYSGNLMADGRDRTLREQALDALRVHIQDQEPVSTKTLNAIIRFESQIYVAQAISLTGGSLSAGGAHGGPSALAAGRPGVLDALGHEQRSEFKSWSHENARNLSPAQRAFRASVARGIEIFRHKTFLISDSAGLNSMNFGNPTRNTCSFCHNMARTGMDVAPGQVDIGTTNEPFADPQPDLPLFKLTCYRQYPPQPYLGRVVYTHDPGYALTTGKCADIGKITVQDLRGISARPPYFSNGSAATLRAVVDFYNRRYDIGLTNQEKKDLVNLLSVL